MASAVATRRSSGTKKSAPAKKSKAPAVASSARAALESYEIHEAANMFPMIDDENLKALAADIAEHGQQEPIWMYQGQLLDGRNRVVACALVGKQPIRQEWKPKRGETPATFVMSRNLHRRHLTASQRAALAVELEAVIAAEAKAAKAAAKKNPAVADPFLRHDQPSVSLASASAPAAASVEFTDNPELDQPRVGEKVRTGRVRDQAASTMRVSAGYVNDAKDLKKAAPEKFEQVKSGQLTLARAQDEVVREAHSKGSLDEVKLRPGAIRAAMDRMEAENRPKAKEKPAPIRLPKATKVQSSATTLSVTVTFGNAKIAEEYLNKMQEDKRVLDLDYEVLEKRPRKRKART